MPHPQRPLSLSLQSGFRDIGHEGPHGIGVGVGHLIPRGHGGDGVVHVEIAELHALALRVAEADHEAPQGFIANGVQFDVGDDGVQLSSVLDENRVFYECSADQCVRVESPGIGARGGAREQVA